MMTPVIPNLAPTGQYSIQDVCLALGGIHRNTLRAIPQESLPKHHHMNGRPFYYGIDVNKYIRKNVRQ